MADERTSRTGTDTTIGEGRAEERKLAVRYRPPRIANYSVNVLLLLMLAGVIWAFLAQVDRVVVAKGRLASTASNLLVQPLETSIIREVKVSVGQVVRKGDVLVSFDPIFAEADVVSLRNRLEAQTAVLKRLTAEKDSRAFPLDRAEADKYMALQENIHRTRLAGFKARLAEFNGRLAELRTQIRTSERLEAALRRRLAIASDIEGIREQLYQAQHGSRLLALVSRASSLEISQELEEILGRGARLRHERRALAAERVGFIEQWHEQTAEELAEVVQHISDIREKLAKAEKVASMVELRAPSDAVVLQIAERSVGAVVKLAEPLVTLVPLNSPLRVEAEVSTLDIGHIGVGDAVRVKLDAFAFQTYGTLDGKVEVIGGDTLSRETEKGPQMYYVIYAALASRELPDLSTDTRLLPGMTVSAEINVGKRTVISYLLHPLLRVFDEGLREP